jgi:hypothetical protein
MRCQAMPLHHYTAGHWERKAGAEAIGWLVRGVARALEEHLFHAASVLMLQVAAPRSVRAGGGRDGVRPEGGRRSARQPEGGQRRRSAGAGAGAAIIGVWAGRVHAVGWLEMSR